MVPVARGTAHARPRGRSLSRHHHRDRGTVRIAQPARAELSAARRAGRGRHAVTQDRRPGKGVFHGAAPPGARRARRASPRLGASPRGMNRLALIKLLVAAAGIMTWGYGARLDNERVRLAGMIVIAVAVALRLLPARVRARIE